MPAVGIDYLQDGVRAVYIRKKVGGVGVGTFLRVGGVNTASAAREATVRDVPGNNVIYRTDSKFQKYTVPVGFYGLRPEAVEFYLGGSLRQLGDVAVFEESANSQPSGFEMFIESDSVGSGNEAAAMGEYYPVCVVSNFQNPKTSGEYVNFTADVTATADPNGIVRHLIFDRDSLPFAITDNMPTLDLPVALPADGATSVSLTADITLTFAVNIDNATAQAIELYNNSDNTLVPASVSTTTTVVTVNPTSDLDASTSYTLRVPGSVAASTGGAKLGNAIYLDFTTAAS
jgi:hypothetical protein